MKFTVTAAKIVSSETLLCLSISWLRTRNSDVRIDLTDLPLGDEKHVAMFFDHKDLWGGDFEMYEQC